ncbi:peptidase domain-containing ABC transporter [Streptomyces brevispora]|uniref:peptidase domain-containing ABC transporter n=1 Tax=Streptomyces brevispora TaxID=887462 RepID=UPI0037241855
MKWQKYHTHQAGDTDCGPACVRTVLRRHGILVDATILREASGLGMRGSNLLKLRQTLSGYGIDSDLLRLDTAQLASAVRVAGPAIILLDEEGYRHFVVVHEVTKSGGLLLSDPMFIRPRLLSSADLALVFHGETLVTDRPAARLTLRARMGHLRSQHLLWDAVRERWPHLLLILGLTTVVSLVALLTSLFLQVSVDRIMDDGSLSTLAVLSLSFITVALCASVMQYVRGRIIVTLGQSLQRQFSERYVRKLLNVPVTFLQSRRTGDLVSRLNDVQEIQQLVAATTVRAAIDICVVLSVGGYLLTENPGMFLLLLPPAGINAASSYFLFPYIRQAAEESLQRDATLQAETLNTLNGISELTSYGRRSFAFRRIARTLERRVQSETHLGRLDNVNSVIKFGNRTVFTVVISWAALTQMLANKMTIGEVFGFLTMSGYFLGSMESIATLQTTLQRTSAALGRYRDVILQEEDPRISLSKEAPLPPLDTADISIRSLAYTYPGSPRPTLQNIELDLPFGSTLLLQGGNGSGKSTLLRVMAGMYGGYRGNVAVGGSDICTLQEEVLPTQILYVPENPLLLTGSLRDNLTLGVEHSTADIVEACRVACFIDVLELLPEGLDWPVREDGTGLSRGQIQRLSIARAVLHAPRVFLFDESFSGIDRETFARIWGRLMTVKASKVLVSHGAAQDLDFDMRLYLEQPGGEA